MKKMKLRTVAICIVISWAMAMLVAGLYGGEVLEYSMDNLIHESKMPDLFIEFSSPQNISDLEPIFDDSADIEAYDLRLEVSGMYVYEGENYPVVLLGLRDPQREDINKLKLIDGKFYEKNSGEAIAISGMEDKGVKPGGYINIDIFGKSLNTTITGTVTSVEFLYASALSDYSIPVPGTIVVLILPLEDLWSVTDHGVNDVIILLDDDGKGENVIQSLDGYPIKSVTDQDSHPAVKAMDIGIGKMKNMFPVMSVIFVFIGFISIFMTVYRTVQNDSRLIGVLMSLGYDRKEIIRSYMSMGLVLSIIGCILGLFFAFLFTLGIASGMEIWVKDFKIVFPFSPLPFVIGIIYTTLVVMISVYIPVRLITRTTVREALEYKPRGTIHTSRLFSGKLSKMSLMGVRNATRHPLRLLVTVFVVAITLGTAGAWLIMTDSAIGYIDEQLATDTWDLRADFLTPAPEAEVNASYLGLNSEDTEYVIPFSFLMGNVRKGGSEETGAILACDEMKSIKDFSVREGDPDFKKAVISNKLADDLGASVGDSIKLDFGTDEIELKVSAVVYDVVAHSVYTYRDNIQSIFPASNCSGVFIKLTEPSADEELAKVVRNNPNVSKVVVHSTISDSLKDFFNEAIAFLYIFFFISLGIAFVVASSAVVISTMERDVEYATLKTLGITRGQVAKSIFIEMGVLSGLSALIGIPFAYFFAFILAKVMEQVVFFFPIYFTPLATLLTFLFGFIFVLLAAVVPIRYSAKLDTEKTIRERTAG